VRFGLFLDATDVHSLIELGIAAETEEFDSIWAPDHFTDPPPSSDRYDPWTVLGAIGAKTERVLMGTLATDCVRRHPASIAHVAATLDNITKGRAILGIGAGEAMNIKPYGLTWEDPQTRVARLRESIQVIRLLWHSNLASPVNFQGQFYRLTDACLDIHPYGDRNLPIHIAALGSKRCLELAGELGDGYLPWFNIPESYAQRKKVIDEAAARAGRPSHEIQKAAVVCLCLSEDQNAHKKVLDSMKPEIVMFPGARRFTGLGQAVNKKSENYSYQSCLASGVNSERARNLGEILPDSFARKFLVAGSANECIDQLEKLVKAGAGHLIMRNMLAAHGVEDFHITLRRIAKEIIPVFT